MRRRVMRMRAAAGALLVLPLLAACEPQPSDRFAEERERLQRVALDRLGRQGYSVHRHARPEFVVAYPAALLQPLGGTDAGDGQRFASADAQVTMTAMVDDDADSTTLRQLFAREVGGNGAGASTMPNGGQFVVTRQVDGHVRYVKASLRDGRLAVLTIEYDTTRTGQLADVVPHVASVFPP